MSETVLQAPSRTSFFRRFTWLHVAWLQAAVAMSGSLYFSEVMLFPPCSLCWYQRICMYPLVLIIGTGIWRRDKHVRAFALPLSLVGLAISFYHNALTYGFVAEGACSANSAVSCTTRWINWFGFVTIPLLSFIAFAVIATALVAYSPREE